MLKCPHCGYEPRDHVAIIRSIRPDVCELNHLQVLEQLANGALNSARGMLSAHDKIAGTECTCDWCFVMRSMAGTS